MNTLFVNRKIQLAVENMERRIKTGMSYEDVWNATSIELSQAAESHCRVFLVETFINGAKGLTSLSKNLQEVLLQLCELYSIHWVLQKVGDFLRVRKYSHTSNFLHKILNTIKYLKKLSVVIFKVCLSI